MRAYWSRVVLAVGVTLVVSEQAQAQPLFGHAESLECTVANADLVIVGKLSEFRGGGLSEGLEGTIDVEETLKAGLFTIEPYQRIRVPLPYPSTVLANWKDRSRRLLVAVKEDAPNATSVIALTIEGLPVLTADFQLLRDPEAVIRTARETVRRIPAPVRRIQTFELMVPREAVAGTKWEQYYGTGGSLVLSVPADDRLETRALDEIRSAAYEKRVEGARALRYFPSPENIGRVKKLLDDPGWGYLSRSQENQGIEVRLYGVRQEAYRTLKSWGVNGEPPLIREEVRK